MNDESKFRARIDGLMPADRRGLLRRLDSLSNMETPDHRAQLRAKIGAEVEKAEQRIERRRAARPVGIVYPPDLPISGRHHDLAATIREHQVVIVAGETGSGKSTQIPKMCLELGRGVQGFIGHTQPRRIAARSIAERIAEELNTQLGDTVGYAVRFTDRVGANTLIKVMTDGVLLAEIHRDPKLLRYDTIIIDEAHERSLNVDFLLGYLRNLLPRRPDLKLIITSATIDTERFSAHFNDAPIVEVSGRSHPVDIRYRPLDDPPATEVRDQPQAICDAVVELSSEGTGDILVFCSGEREIRDAADALAELELRHTEIVPLYGRLSAAEQHRVFEGHTGRRIVIATNVAETSLTVPGVRSVIDPGTARISRASRTGVQRLPIEAISQASANQRAGRCGRLGPGVCIRLYSEDDFMSRPAFTEPEIQRTNLASVILQMAALGLGQIESFPFLDPPDPRNIRIGTALLEELGALAPQQTGKGQRLTKLGRNIAQIPTDPRLARMLLAANSNGCLREVLVIVSALSIIDPRERPTDKEQLTDEKHRRFTNPESDLLGWLTLWEYLGEERKARTSNQFRRMCRDDYLNYRRLREWQDIHQQLRQVATAIGLSANSIPAPTEAIHRSILTGLLSQIGVKEPDSYEYRGVRGARFAIAPGSVLFKRAPKWVMVADLVETSRMWARGIAAIQPEWVEAAGEHLVTRSYSDPWWDPEKGSAVANETVTIFGLTLVPARAVLYAKVDPVAARALFIRHALVLGEWETHHRFSAHNRAISEEVEAIQTRERRLDLLADDESIATFFDKKIPESIVSTRHFDRWWRDKLAEQPHLLDLSTSDLIDPDVERAGHLAFPEVWHHGDVTMDLTYEFDPSSPTDGVTIDVPVDRLDRVDPSIFDWQVPGLRVELIDSLIRSLPKQLRKEFSPIADTVTAVLAKLESDQNGGLVESLRRELTKLGGIPIAPDAFDLTRLAPHLRPTFRVIDQAGNELATSDDLATLKVMLAGEARDAVSAISHPLEQLGLTAWTIGELPKVVEIEGAVGNIRAYPALVDETSSVAVRILATPGEQHTAMREGTRRLLILGLSSPAKLGRALVNDRAKLILKSGPYETASEWLEDCLFAAVDGIVADAGGPAWDAVGFDRLTMSTRDNLHARLTTIGHDSLAAMEALWAAGVAVDRLPAQFDAAIADVTHQVNQIVYPGFITAMGGGRMPDVGRYLLAVERRLERLPADPEKDAQLMAQVHQLEAEHDKLLDALGSTPEMVEVAWMLQELRVSLFAQQLGTNGPVSAKRIRRAMQEALS